MPQSPYARCLDARSQNNQSIVETSPNNPQDFVLDLKIEFLNDVVDVLKIVAGRTYVSTQDTQISSETMPNVESRRGDVPSEGDGGSPNM